MTLDCALFERERREKFVNRWTIRATISTITLNDNTFLTRIYSRWCSILNCAFIWTREKRKFVNWKNSCNNFSLTSSNDNTFLTRIYSQWCSNDPQSCTYSNIFTIIFKRFSIAHLFDRKRRENLSMSNNFFDYVD